MQHNLMTVSPRVMWFSPKCSEISWVTQKWQSAKCKQTFLKRLIVNYCKKQKYQQYYQWQS